MEPVVSSAETTALHQRIQAGASGGRHARQCVLDFRWYSPDGWANKTLEVSDRWKADKIVAEVNYGGAMVEATIRTARRHAPIKLLNASRGKVQRAEPIVALYAQGKVRHDA
jgi:phage terminase large subunit-like protein